MTESSGAVVAPAGVQTFLIADIRGYSRFTSEHGDEAGARLALRFAEITESVVAAHEGRVIELRGDEALAAFASVRAALRAAVELQERFGSAPAELPLKVGIGIDAGESVPVRGGYRGTALNLAARLCSLAGAGEVLASEGVVHLARHVDGIDYEERGMATLKGFADPVRIISISRAEEPQVPPRDSGSQREQNFPIGGFLGALPGGPLVAREEELGRAVSAADSAAGGTGRLVLLAGEPGVGKTRLAQEVALAARNRGYLLATGRCYEPYAGIPFYPFREAMAMAYEAASPALRARAHREWPHLLRLLPDAADAPPSSGSGHEEQQRIFWSASGFIQSLAAERPLALLLDDLHWADNLSLQLLEHLARQTRAHRVLLVGTFRDTEVGREHPLERVLLDLTRERLAERVPVRRLGPEGTAALLASAIGESEVSKEFVELVHARTEGNAFFTEEVARALVEQGDLYRENGLWMRRDIDEIEVPESIRAVVGQRLARLPETAQGVLHDASVFGHSFAFDDLQSLTGLGEDALEEALDLATAAGLVKSAGGDTFGFSHALTQQVLYGELSPRRRRRLHLAAGEALERQPRGPERHAAELARHFKEGSAPDRALPFAILAGDQAETVFGHRDAAGHYETALRLTQDLGDRRREAAVREKLGGLLTATIRYRAALEMLEAAAAMFRESGDVESEGRVVAQIGRVHFVNGSVDSGIERLERMLRRLGDDAAPKPVAGISSALSHLYFARGQYSYALAASERAVELARRAGDAWIESEAEVRRGATLAALGRVDEGWETLAAALDRAAAAGDQFSRCRALQSMAGIWVLRGDVRSARQALTEACDLAQRMGNTRQVAVCTLYLSLLSLLAGDLAAATSDAEAALGVMRSLEGSWATACQIIGFDTLELSPAQWDAAPHYLREALSLGRRTTSGQAPGSQAY
jgi:class 3 adenylate cyclase/tetratricopeptide (TPR) repeat protein